MRDNRPSPTEGQPDTSSRHWWRELGVYSRYRLRGGPMSGLVLPHANLR